MSPVPDRPTHDLQFSETDVHVAKQTRRKHATQTDFPTKLFVAEAVKGMKFETQTKLNCQIHSLIEKMARLARQTNLNYPIPPRPLEDLNLPIGIHPRFLLLATSPVGLGLHIRAITL